jgi:hypothetical protein
VRALLLSCLPAPVLALTYLVYHTPLFPLGMVTYPQPKGGPASCRCVAIAAETMHVPARLPRSCLHLLLSRSAAVNFCREVSTCVDCTSIYSQGCAWNDNIVPSACVPKAECDYFYEAAEDRMVSLNALGPTRSACKATPTQCGVASPSGAVLDANEERGGGCTTHEQCSANQYCMSCAVCVKNGAVGCGNCAPGPSYMGGVAGNCGPLSSCRFDRDSITGTCPPGSGAYSADYGFTNSPYLTIFGVSASLFKSISALIASHDSEAHLVLDLSTQNSVGITNYQPPAPGSLSRHDVISSSRSLLHIHSLFQLCSGRKFLPRSVDVLRLHLHLLARLRLERQCRAVSLRAQG